MMRNRFSSACRRARIGAAAIGSLLLLSSFSISPALAELKEIVIAPAEPTTCDPVSITVVGALPDPCYEVVSAVIRGPEEIPCAGPRPCPIGFRVEITVREPNPDSERACPTVITPYTRSFDVGRLRESQYLVTAHERIVPYAADSTDSTVSHSFAHTTFTVRPDSVCPPPQGCYILDFRPDRSTDPIPGTFCTAVAPPGGTACLALTLMNTNAVGGLQTTLNVTSANGTSADPFIRAVSVDPVGRAAGFQVGWTAEGSKTKILLYSTTGASIPPGDGPVIRICYSVAPETVPQMFRIHDFPTIVADTAGGAIPPCPTLANEFRETSGIICVTTTGCDVNGDGVSDVLDVIRIVRCALAADNDSSACPDSVAARADCNGDGSIDIRDVICCVRKILQFPSAPRIGTAPAVGQGGAIGFEGGVRWINAAEGTATVRIDTGDDWGGTQFAIGPSLGPLRVRRLSLVGATATEPLEWAIDGFGTAHAMLYATTAGTRPARTYRVEVTFERTQSGSASLEIGNVRAGTSAGTEAPASLSNTTLLVPEAPVTAPALLAARPNPSAGKTEIGFVLPAGARVTLHVYDVAGRLVRTLVDGTLPAGVHRAQWNGTDNRGRAARSGLYFTKLVVGKTIRSERIMLLR